MYLAAQCFIEDYENTLEAKISSQIEDEKVSDQSICVTYTMFLTILSNLISRMENNDDLWPFFFTRKPDPALFEIAPPKYLKENKWIFYELTGDVGNCLLHKSVMVQKIKSYTPHWWKNHKFPDILN